MNNLKIDSIDDFKRYKPNNIDNNKIYNDILELYNKFRDIYYKICFIAYFFMILMNLKL